MSNTTTSVLVIDDDPISRELLQHLLTQRGYSVKTADSGADALQQLADPGELPPQAILADLQMPGIRGNSLAEAIREHSSSPPILIAMSATAPGEAVYSSYDTFLLKPFTMDQFAAAITSDASIPTLTPAITPKTTSTPDSASQEDILNPTTYEKLASSMSPEQLHKLYTFCLDDAQQRIDSMREAVQANDDATFRRQAHSIKGGCGMVGAIELQKLAATMENNGLAANHVATLDEFLLASERLAVMLNARKNSSFLR
jgi:CheY-like chemotaxis protein